MDETRLVELVQRFRDEYLPSDHYREHTEEHRRRKKRAVELLAAERIPALTEAEIRELFFDSDAFSFWKNKEWEFQKRLQKHGIEGLRDALAELVRRGERGITPEDLVAVWKMQGTGPLLSTELLAYRFPDRYYTYSGNVTLPALLSLGDDVKKKAPWGQKSDAWLYDALRPRIERIHESLANAGLPEADNLLVDMFLWWINDRVPPATDPTPTLTRAAVETALTSFDAEARDTPAWADWEKDGRHHYAIRWEGRRYPVKEIVRRATGKEDFSSAAVRPKLAELGFEILENAARGARVWVFQARPERYVLAERVVEEAQTYWEASQHQTELRRGDVVVLWQSGEARGVYALGRLASDVYEAGDGSPIVDVAYGGLLKNPVMQPTLAADPVLRELAVLRFPRGTIFPVTPEQWAVLEPLLGVLQPAGRKVVRWADDHQPEVVRPVRELLAASLAIEGLHFSEWQVASFYTALQTKGFVLLSGISGTGKTKLAQHIARLLPAAPGPATPEEEFEAVLTVQPYMLKYGRFIIPKKALRVIDYPKDGESRNVTVHFDGEQETCRLLHARYEKTSYVLVNLRGKARAWFIESFGEGDTFGLNPDLDDDGNLCGLRIIRPEVRPEAAATTPPPTAPDADARNYLFLPVRPDWRDGKSLLGYFNPLTQAYEWTPFLRFLQRAAMSYRDGDGLAWFVVLDEMNLAHVEYYFADILSVLESGREEDDPRKLGWTREALQFVLPDEAEGDVPPRSLSLPPNLYIVGTVNVDETTRSISPKVLDRAFTLELTEADFSSYLVTTDKDAAPPPPTLRERQSALDQFTRRRRFARVEKATVLDYVGRHPVIRDRLQTLNGLLRPYRLHFGFRVFDEIVAYLAAAEENALYAAAERAAEADAARDAAFDAAVLMKVLPKFHGSRARLEAPLRAVLGWCMDPSSPNVQAVDEALAETENAAGLQKDLENLEFRMPATADRAGRMLWALYVEGFASFG